ncbi:hypothetical protein QPL79_03615 [Ignisphaera sp. 4213-co]|uniref:Uncharacterized protein n=1 Tax=Ignisphaera cupida TaxID=3050454 RepID=A0ABD4Z773_9CREN|nr:hypothetical protein [Ignisphaera sp. 4213-co]MDK6028443.1 hypothetical protein [Ignisphaera sp. 4213-co]
MYNKKEESEDNRHFSRRNIKRENNPRREERFQKPIHRQHVEYRDRESRQELVPRPIGTQCAPTCPLFRCGKRALIIKLVDGRPTAWCSWVNDYCIGYKCQYASCSMRYLLPDGRCLFVVKGSEKSEDEFLKEVEKKDDLGNLKSLLSRRGIRKDLGIEDL